MTNRLFSLEDLQTLKQWDTPTICNGLELVVPERRSTGFTTKHMIAADMKLAPMVGLARVGTMRTKEAPRSPVAERADWYDYVAAADLPTVVVMQDLDDQPGYGAIWGEVHTLVHQSLGALGCVTNGSFRDTDMLAPGFQIIAAKVVPSHSYSHFVDFGKPVNVSGMQTCHDDVIHADHHGAVIIPPEAVRRLPEAIEVVMRREKVIMDVCRDPAFTPAKLREALRHAKEIH